MHACMHVQTFEAHRSCDEVTARGVHQEADRLGHVARLCDSLHGVHGDEVLHALLGLVAAALRRMVDQAGRHTVDAHALVGKLSRRRAVHACERGKCINKKAFQVNAHALVGKVSRRRAVHACARVKSQHKNYSFQCVISPLRRTGAAGGSHGDAVNSIANPIQLNHRPEAKKDPIGTASSIIGKKIKKSFRSIVRVRLPAYPRRPLLQRPRPRGS